MMSKNCHLQFLPYIKIGQGTYSSVFRARELETGRMVALKKVRFDNFQPESIRFMAREILILRRLDHPNVMKLEGIITSRLSSSIYLVFEYMEHDLAGLSSSPDIEFTESQVCSSPLLNGLVQFPIFSIQCEQRSKILSSYMSVMAFLFLRSSEDIN